MELRSKKNILYIITLFIALIIVGRLIQLQVFGQQEYGKESEKNAVKKIIVTPARGLMYNRNGKVIVDNKPSYTLTITPYLFEQNNLETISGLAEVEPEYIIEQISKATGTNRFNPVKIKRDLNFKSISYIEENRDKLQGIDYEIEAIRVYPDNFKASHIFGYTSEITEKQLSEQSGSYYRQGDIIGSTGLEKQYENFLRGEKGVRFITVDVKGKEVGKMNDGNDDVKPLNGYDLFLSIDSELQEYAEKLLSNKKGAIIAIDPQNGEILCMVSKPDFDLSVFAGSVKPEVFNNLVNDKDKPLFNRATQTKYPPGSTWKMMMAMAGLSSGKITPTSTINCPGSYTLGNRTFKDHGSYGNINVVKAIEVSSNVFFYKLSVMIGLENYHYYGKLFGFGTKTGIDIPNETSGLLPSEEYYKKIFGPQGHTAGTLVSLGIGQGELGVSPVQMVCYTAAVCNDGLYSQPHFVRKIKNNITGEEEFIKFNQRRIELPQKYFDLVKRGMYLVVNGPGGTARGIKSDEFILSGKTGTAQNPSGNNHSWFVGFAPYDEPKIAICVLGEFMGWGSQFAAPVAAALMIKYLSGQEEYNESAGNNIAD
ncbi:MAG: penicillin-binding protein 2 [Ignavibacteria bacterium]|nr:penicillin-binding protein 2 [Ignavibacteria bacterium]